MKHYLLERKEFPDSHTGENVAQELVSILADWGLSKNSVSAITTDNGRNVATAIKQLSWTNIPCFLHTLQLGVEKFLKLPQVSKAISLCKRILTHFYHSSKSSYILKEKTKKPRTPRACVDSRSFYSLEFCILHGHSYFRAATLLEIHKTDLMPTDAEFNSLEEFVKVMKPLVDITEAIGSEQWITISTMRPILSKLTEAHLVHSATDSSLIKTMKKVMFDDLKERYTGNILTKSTIFDPRFKHLKFLPECERKEATESLKLDID